MIRCKVAALSLLAVGLCFMACAGKPQAPAEPAPVQVAPPEVNQPEPIPAPEPAILPPEPALPPPVFDPSKVTAEEKQEAIVDIRGFIESLNTIIQNKDYEAWKSNLTGEFIEYYSSPAFLQQTSENPRFKNMNIKLNSLKDYFTFVVYPSHQHDHIDDIEFIGEHMVKAFTKGTKGDLYVLYSLEKQNGIWKIGIGR
jgi:hypothetical protein